MRNKHCVSEVLAALVIGAAVTLPAAAVAAVTADEAAKLKTSLTPLGGERAGNKAGTIPEWTGGLKSSEAPPQTSAKPPKVFADEKPLYSINAGNVDQHADKLSEGQKVLLKTLPNYRIDVYPTHRTAAVPNYIAERTFRNATTLKLDGRTVIGGYKGGIPFPVPQSGLEAIFNTQYIWRGHDNMLTCDTWVISANGKRTLATRTVANETHPLDYPDERKSPWGDGVRYAVVVETLEPPYQAGEKIAALIPTQLNVTPSAWVYLTGQRRVRKTPNVEYDVPSPFASGVINYDDQNGFQGQEDRYEWKLAGKREMIVPYNNNAFGQVDDPDKLLGPQYANPDHQRWEMHRVWALEGTLKAGSRHVVPKRTLYIDEDTWQIVMSDQWDAKGQFWKFIQLMNFVAPHQPGIMQGPTLTYNVQAKAYTVFNVPTRGGGISYKQVDPAMISPQALEAGGVR